MASEVHKPKADWELIEIEYRGGRMPIKTIGKTYGVSSTRIRQKAAKGTKNKDGVWIPWTRDLSESAEQATNAAIAVFEARASNQTVGGDPGRWDSIPNLALSPREEAILQLAARRGVEVARDHRRDLSRLRTISEALAGRLLALLDAQAAGDHGPGNIIPAFLGDRESYADVLVKLAKTSALLIPLEREAFGLEIGDKNRPELSSEQIRRMALEVVGGDETLLVEGAMD